MEDKIIEIENGVKNHQFRCPNCGQTEIFYKNKKLECSYCHTIFDEEKVKDIDIDTLEGRNIGLGAKDINNDDIVTITCNSCGAQVTINKKEAPFSRCHWCHSILSLDNKIESGTVPDVILPFSVEKEEAFKLIGEYVLKRSFFANKDFIENFSIDNVMGVYLPYMLVDTNAHCTFQGEGEHLVRSYSITVGHDKDGDPKKETRYDADLYEVNREFDMIIDDLTIESSIDKTKYDVNKTNYIINSIMPFDTNNCISFKANYLIGYTSERRDINIKDLENKVKTQVNDICRLSINRDLKFFNRGIKWVREDINVIGNSWVSAYMPVWLYSFREKKRKNEIIHYVAVNGRTKEIVGSIPVSKKKLLFISLIIEIFILLLCLLLIFTTSNPILLGTLFFLAIGIVFYFVVPVRYKNTHVRHAYEYETKYKLYNIKRNDKLIKHYHGLSRSYMIGANNKRRDG